MQRTHTMSDESGIVNATPLARLGTGIWRGHSLLILVAVAALSTVSMLALLVSRDQAQRARLAAEAATASAIWEAIPGPDYFVATNGNDDQDGSVSYPWATLQHAASKAEAGSTVHVFPGLYQGPVVTRRDGQPQARIRFLSERQWQARILAMGSPIVWKNEGTYVDIAGFDISGDGAYGILNLGSNVRIVGNHVHDIPARGCTSEGGAGIDNGNYSAHDDDVIGNVVNNIGDPNHPCNRVHGIYHSNLRGHIWNNIACDNQGWGIHLWHAPRSVVIANNLICHNGEGGIVIGAGDAPGALPADHMLVTNNVLIGNGRSKAAYAIDEFGLLGDDNHYLNNLIFGREQRVVLQHGNDITGTIWSDPVLVDYKLDGTGDYHLSTGSPAIGAGTRVGAPPLDLDGAARPVAGRWDVGPYQYKSHGKPWPWY